MPSKRRSARNSSAARLAKRQKASGASGQGAGASVDLTALNAITSPLLRLPAELRDQIWRLAFSNKMIWVYSYRSRQEEEQEYELAYVPYDTVCDHPKGSDAWIFEMDDEASQRAAVPQFVCRQYWAETSRIYLNTCTFRVDNPLTFRALATSEKPIVAQICRLMIHASGRKSHNFPMYWQDVFSSALVGRFVSLEGLRLTGKVYWGPENQHRCQNVMTGSHWRMTKLSNTIQSFQQHKLKENLTSVAIEAYCYEFDRPWTAGPINEAIRKNLLEHHPRRRSARRS